MGTLTVLRLRRIITGVSQATLAAAAGRTQAWYSRLERGVPGATINPSQARAIELALGARAGSLFVFPDHRRRAA